MIFGLSGALLLAAVIGTSDPAQSITAARIAQLPNARQAAWRDYLDRSIRQNAADRAVLAAELKSAEPSIPPNGSAARSMPLDRPADWYASPEARRIADNIVSFQTPAGGWSKNLNLADHARRKGESFAPNNLSHFLTPGDFDTPADPQWNYVGTLDNDATTTELQFLAKVIQNGGATYQASFLHGVEYLLAAQFPNGGWPQVWPLEGGYHDAITFNDGAVTETLEFLEAVAHGVFSFVPDSVAKSAQASVARGVDCILATQILNPRTGRRTVWGQQHDALTLEPVAGRNYEPRAECSAESAGITRFLMKLPNPAPNVIAAVDAAARWFKETAVGPQNWARFYEIGTERPIFGDRDKSIHDTVSELSAERQRGYRWYNPVPQGALDQYAEWRH